MRVRAPRPIPSPRASYPAHQPDASQPLTIVKSRLAGPWHSVCGRFGFVGGASDEEAGEELMLRKLGLVAACLFLALPILT